MTTTGKILFYPFWISNHASRQRGTAHCWGKPQDSMSAAAKLARAEVDAGRAVFSCVVRFANGVRTPLASSVRPAAALAAVTHWEALWDAVDPPG